MTPCGRMNLLCHGALTSRIFETCGLPASTSRLQDPTPARISVFGKPLFSASNNGVMTSKSPISLFRRTKIFLGTAGGASTFGAKARTDRTNVSKRSLRQLTGLLPTTQDFTPEKTFLDDGRHAQTNVVEMRIADLPEQLEHLHG